MKKMGYLGIESDIDGGGKGLTYTYTSIGKIVLVGLLLTTQFVSCNKEDIEPEIRDEVLKIRSVVISDLPFYEYSYNNAGGVNEQLSKTSLANYNFNENDQLAAIEYSSDKTLLTMDLKALENALNQKGLINLVYSETGSKLVYKYDIFGQLASTTFSRPTESIRESSEFWYDANGRIGRQKLLWDGDIIGHIDYVYDDNGNLIKETLYSISSTGLPELSTTKQYEYDNYHNPFKVLSRLMTPGTNTNMNNIVKETLTIHFKPGEGTDIVQVTDNSYTYNKLGYPIRKNGNIQYLYE